MQVGGWKARGILEVFINYNCKMQNTNIVTDEENVAGVGAPVALVGREAGRWLQAGGGGGRLCRTQLQLALRAAWRDQGPSRTHTPRRGASFL